MFKRFLIPFVISLWFFAAYPQPPEKLLSNWSGQSPVEKAYLHFDRDDYVAGHTIWFKAYLYSDFLPADKSTSLYVEMLNGSSSMISRQVFPVFGGFSRGQIELPDTLPEGSYVIRAYTATMLNHEPDFIFKRTFHVTGKKVTGTNVMIRPPAIRLDFFPEGGNLVTGLSNSVAFKATDQDGLPVSVSGTVKKENGEILTELTTYHDGMGFFDLIAEAGVRYYVIFHNDLSGHKYYLPEQTTKGVVLRIISSGKIKTYEVLQRKDDPVFKAAYMVGQMQHHPVFRKDFKDNTDEMTGMIQTDKLASGILHITVFNKDGLPLAERLTFVDNKEYVLQGDLITDTLDFSERAKNQFTISLPDTVKGSFSVSVTDPAFDLLPLRQQNIFSGLLLTSDLKGYIHDPAWYFSNRNADSIQNALDLVMMTNGWRRFRWEELIKRQLPVPAYADSAFINMAGQIQLQGTNKPFAEKDLLAIIIPSDNSKNMQMLQTDNDGRFRLDSIVFFGPARIFFTDVRGKKNKFIVVKLDADSLNRPFLLPVITDKDIRARNIPSWAGKSKMLEEYESAGKEKGIMLGNVTVKGHKPTKLEEFEEKYVKGMFAGDALRKIDLQEEDLTAYQNIFDYLRLRVPGLTIVEPNYENEIPPAGINDEGAIYRVFFRQSASVSSMGNIPMALYLDEIETSANVIATMPANQIAVIKVFSTFAAATGAGAGGALAIYTKRGNELTAAMPSAGDILNYTGYSVLKEFYSPDYSVKSKTVKRDHRSTLYWNPTVFVNGIHPSFPVKFYNNDRTRQFKIVVEGMTTDGKMLLIEKLVTAKKAF